MKIPSFKEMIQLETDDFVFISKPPFISTLSDRNSPQNILDMARDYLPSLQVGHRLDKETSGILALAKNAPAYRHLSMLFENRQVVKQYHAIVHGVQNFQGLVVDAPLSTMRNGMVKVDRQHGKKATTTFKTVAVYYKHSLVACLPESGRMHQIRIHLSLTAAPIVGDDQYGGMPLYLSAIKPRFKLKQNTEERPLMNRVALHALSLQLRDLSNQTIEVSAPHPKDFAATLRQLERNCR